MNVMTRLFTLFPSFWEAFKTYWSPGLRDELEAEEATATDEPPSKRRRMDDDSFLLGMPSSETNDSKQHLNPAKDEFLLPREDNSFNLYKKVKRKSQLESSIGCNTHYYGTYHSETIEKSVQKVGKENRIRCDDNGNENKLSEKNPVSEGKTEKSDSKVFVITTPKFQKSERGMWLDAESTCSVSAPIDAKSDKENSQQLRVVAPSFLQEQRISPKRMFTSLPGQLLGTGTSRVGQSTSLKRPNASSISSMCSSSSSTSGRKLQLLDECIRLEEREKYSELLQSFTRVPMKKCPRSAERPEKVHLNSLASFSRRKFGKKVEVIDLTSQSEVKHVVQNGSTDNKGITSELADPLPSAKLREKLDKCDVFDISWLEELLKFYNRSDNDRRKQLLEEKTKAAICTEKSDQLLNEILEEKVRVHLRLTQVAVEEGPIPVAEDEVTLPKLTPEIEEQVAYAFKSGPGGEILAEAFSLRITRRDMRTLVGTNWLNDEIINFYMNLLIERGKLDNYPSVYCFNTFFYPKLNTQGHAALKRWTRRIDVFAHDLLIIPIHLGVHWCLACANMKGKKILYYDSMGGRNNTCLQNLLKYLQDESLDKKKTKFDTSGWSLENVKDNPQQLNGSDCGMFSCMYAEYLCRQAKINFSQSDMPYFRRKMAYEILTKKLML